jgi:hypothetical protein
MNRYVYCEQGGVVNSKPKGVFLLRDWGNLFCIIKPRGWRLAFRCHEAFRGNLRH